MFFIFTLHFTFFTWVDSCRVDFVSIWLKSTRHTSQLDTFVELTACRVDSKPSESSLHGMWWSWLTCVLVARDDSTLLTRALKWILRTTLAVSFPVLPSGYICQLTQLVRHRTGSKPTAQISLPKTTSGLRIHPTWTLWITMSGQCWRPITSAIWNRKRLLNWRKSCRWSGTAYLSDQ